MSENKKVMSMAIKPDLQEKVVKMAHLKGQSRSEYIGGILEQAVKISHDLDPMVIGKPMDDDILPVILKIPKAIKGDAEKLKQYLASQMKILYQKLMKE